jgi:phosphoribosyl 1,2-cyclic phosphodiesterase
MVRFTVLASGSRGNGTIITGGRTRILVDAGLSCRELFRRMRLAGENPESLDAILVTHEHQDHVGGLAVTARKLGIPVYFTEATHRAWMRWLAPRRQMTYAQWLEQCRLQAAERQAEAVGADMEGEADDPEPNGECAAGQTMSAAPAVPATPTRPATEAAPAIHESLESPKLESEESPSPGPKDDPTWLPAVEYFEAGRNFSIGDLEVASFTTPHDAADPVGFVFASEGIRMGYATDLGYISPNVKACLQNLDLLLLEANHDLEMLRDGPYPWMVKQRVLSRVGHLSNDATAEFLTQDYDGRAAWIILAHLSENNNLPELARVAAERALSGRPSLLLNRLLIAGQHQPLSPVDF